MAFDFIFSQLCNYIGYF